MKRSASFSVCFEAPASHQHERDDRAYPEYRRSPLALRPGRDHARVPRAISCPFTGDYGQLPGCRRRLGGGDRPFLGAQRAHVVLGEVGWYSSLIFELATEWLPLHRDIWEGAGLGMLLIAAGLIGWAVWELVGAGPLPSASRCPVYLPPTLHWLVALDAHGPAWFTLAILGALLVRLQRNADTFAPRLDLALILVAGLIAGLNAASDRLVLVRGLFRSPWLLRCPWGSPVTAGPRAQR